MKKRSIFLWWWCEIKGWWSDDVGIGREWGWWMWRTADATPRGILPKAEKTAWLCRGPWRLFWCWVKFSNCENNTSGSSNPCFSQIRTWMHQYIKYVLNPIIPIERLKTPCHWVWDWSNEGLIQCFGSHSIGFLL